MNKHSHGFTVVEIIFVVALLATASVFFFVQKNGIEIVARDDSRKTAINAIYYSLEEVFYPAHKYYPQMINTETLPSVDPNLFTDPNGLKLGQAGSDYTYHPTNCTDGQCKSYTLQATLENENDYIKTNREN